MKFLRLLLLALLPVLAFPQSTVTRGGAGGLTVQQSGLTIPAPLVSTSIRPATDDGAPLGDTTHNWSDLFMASGGVFNWANGNVVLTHSSGLLTLGTGDFRITTAGTNSASVVTVGGTQSLTGKTINGNTITTGTGTLTLGSVTLDAGPGGILGTAAFTETDIYASLVADNAFTGLNSFSLTPNIAWTSKATGTSASVLNTQYYFTAFTSNTTISGYTGTPVNGSKVSYLLLGADGVATFSFPSAQRAGDPTGASTVITPTAGAHFIVFTYVNSAWYYQDDIVANTVSAGTTGRTSFTAYAPIFGGTTSTGALQSGTVGNAGEALISNGAGALPTFQTVSATLTATLAAYGSAGNVVTGEAAYNYTAATNTLVVGAVTLGAGGETSTMGQLQTSDGKQLNQVIQTIASGTAYTLTASYATVDFGTTDPVIIIDSPGTYMLRVTIQTSLVSATTTTQTVSYKLRRTNNTAADVAGSTFADPLPIATATTMLGPTTTIICSYTTSNSDDSITIQGALSAAVGGTSATTSAVTIAATRLY